MNWYLEVLKKYAVFSGRARRKEYWYFVLLSMLVSVGLAAIDALVGSAGLLSGLYCLAILIPSVAVLVRRLHDTGHSGWWIFIGLIPLVGIIVLFVFMVLDSMPGDNRYGSNPKGAATA